MGINPIAHFYQQYISFFGVIKNLYKDLSIRAQKDVRKDSSNVEKITSLIDPLPDLKIILMMFPFENGDKTNRIGKVIRKVSENIIQKGNLSREDRGVNSYKTFVESFIEKLKPIKDNEEIKGLLGKNDDKNFNLSLATATCKIKVNEKNSPQRKAAKAQAEAEAIKAEKKAEKNRTKNGKAKWDVKLAEAEEAAEALRKAVDSQRRGRIGADDDLEAAIVAADQAGVATDEIEAAKSKLQAAKGNSTGGTKKKQPKSKKYNKKNKKKKTKKIKKRKKKTKKRNN